MSFLPRSMEKSELTFPGRLKTQVTLLSWSRHSGVVILETSRRPIKKPQMAPTSAAGTPVIPQRLLPGHNQVQDVYATT
jgi:hypothetical protein